MRKKPADHRSWKVAVWIVAPLLTILGVLGNLIAPTKQIAIMNAVFVIAACSVGWALGMILSPDSRVEEKRFGNLWKGISLFASGYLVSKLDPLIEAVMRPEVVFAARDDVVVYRLLACPSAIVLTAILTYIIRVYAFLESDDEKRSDTPTG